MSYREICEDFGYSCCDPDAIDKIIFDCAIEDEDCDDLFDECDEDCDCDEEDN